MKLILAICNLLVLILTMYLTTTDIYLKILGIVIFILSVSIFGITEAQWMRSGFIIIALIFNPVFPLPSVVINNLFNYAKNVNITIFTICIAYNLLFLYKLHKNTVS